MIVAVGGRGPGGPRRWCARTGRERGGAARAPAGSDVPAGGEGPAVGAGPAEAQESWSPASRRGGGMLRPPVPAGTRPRLDGRGERKQDFASFCHLGRKRRGGCQSLGDLWGGRSARRRRVGRRPPSCLENKEPGAGPAGAASASPRRGLPPAASRGGCRKHFPNSAWVGGIQCSFVPRKGKMGRRFLLPCCCPCLPPSECQPLYTHVPPASSRDALCAGELKEWAVKKTARQSVVFSY